MARNQRTTTTIVKYPSFWERRTCLEKLLFLLCILAIIAVIALAISLYVFTAFHRNHEGNSKWMRAEALKNDAFSPVKEIDQIHSHDQDHDHNNEHSNIQEHHVVESKALPLQETQSINNTENLCVSAGCIRATAKIFDTIDESIDPCENFYDFACGTYLRNTFIPDDKTNIDSFSIVRDKVQEQLRAIINEEPKPNESKPFILAKNWNKACLNKTIIETRGIKPLEDILESYGGWPVVKGNLWSEENWNWLDVIKKFRKNGIGTSQIFSFTVTTNLKNSSVRVLDIDQTALGLEREFLIKGINEKFVKAYFDFMVDNAVIFGASKEQAEKELKKSLEFEMKLANITWPKEKRRNASALYNPFLIKELQESYPYIPWLDYINALLPEGLDVEENELVINSVPSFFTELGPILEQTPKRTMANYFMWRVVLALSGTLNNQLRLRKLAYFTALIGQQEEEPRWKECVEFTASSLPISVGALYVRKYFSRESKEAAVELVNNIRSEFVDILHGLSWMDDQTKAAAIEKAKSLTNHIGYPDELADNNKLEEFFKELVIEPDNLLLNTLRLNVFNINYAFNKLREPVNKTDWVTHSKPALVNAAYSPLENSIQFPAAILQDRFFSADRPRYLNYGAIGQIIGHEITHGFDDQGRQFDLDGNLEDWWAADTQKQFLEKAQCIIDQYGNYTDENTELSLNGISTQGENIADNGGVKEAYIAYQKWVQKNGAEGKLPGLKYTQQQLFWISAAQTWCAVSRPLYNKVKITTGVHSPNQFRVAGPISNMRDFAFDFNCPEGTKMNPPKKCEVW